MSDHMPTIILLSMFLFFSHTNKSEKNESSGLPDQQVSTTCKILSKSTAKIVT